MFLGWYDPDKKTPARYKLEDALARYARKFGRPALTCITSPEDAAELEADKEAPTMPVRGAGFIPRHTFYVGSEDEPDVVVETATRSRPETGERKPATRKARAAEPAVPEKGPAAKKAVAKSAPKPKVEPRRDTGVTSEAISSAKPARSSGAKRGSRTRKATGR